LPAIDKRLQVALLAALTIIAAWLRFSAIDFGLPDQFRPDEEMTVPTALGFEKDWNPHLAVYPAAQTYLIHGVLRSNAMLFGVHGDLRTAYGADDGAQAFLIARQISAAMGTLTVPVIYLAAAPVFGPVAAVISATIVTVSYLHVRESKFAKVEVPAGLWLALSILMMLRLVIRGHWMDYALAGFFCGLATATHYTAGAIAIGIVMAHLEARHREARSLFGSLIDFRIYLAGAVTILTFLSVNPYFILDWQQTANDLWFLNASHTMWNNGNTPAGFGWPWLLLLAMPASFGVGWEIFFLAAMLWMLLRPKPGVYALMAFIAVCFWSVTSGHPQLEFRYLVNPLLAMALLAGVFAVDLMAWASAWIGSRAALSLAASVGIVLVTPSLIRDVELNQLLRQEDTRTIAEKWMVDHIPPLSEVVMIHGFTYGKPKVPHRYKMIPIKRLAELPSLSRWAPWVVADSLPMLSLWSEGASDADLAELNSEATLEFDLDPIKAGAATPVFDPNDAFYVPFNNITSMVRPGPRIRIWKVNPALE
jgi:hypothetical protein